MSGMCASNSNQALHLPNDQSAAEQSDGEFRTCVLVLAADGLVLSIVVQLLAALRWLVEFSLCSSLVSKRHVLALAETDELSTTGEVPKGMPSEIVRITTSRVPC